ncbi:PAS domain-containing protein [Phenylobacterium sp. LjRoot225]|uniref:PAS domain-containing sensor histidine kinase n=1 Tax=Phenylobacterium sp. LjRoot225 TaxID=3342285 RepID=UPI003ECF784E
MAEPDDHDEPAFLRDGGALGALIAQHDWAATSLGPLDAWPDSLKTVTAIMLHARVPMHLLWGPEGVMIYNDAYAGVIGRRHPEVLGAKMREAWPEQRALGDQILAAGLAGRTQSLRDREITVRRRDEAEQAWFNVDCWPVLDDRGEPAGVLITSVETTERVLAERKAAIEIERQRRMFEQAPGFICLLSGPDFIVDFVNEAHKQLFAVHDATGKPYMEAFAEIAALGAPEVIVQVYESGERYSGRAEPIAIPKPGGRVEEHLVDLVLEPVTDDEGRVIGLFLEGFEVTEQVRAQAAAEESERRLSAAIAIARLGAFEWDLETGAATLDDRAREIFGFEPGEGRRVEEVVQRMDVQDMRRVAAETDAFDAARQTRREYEYRIHLPDGSTRTITAMTDRIAGPDGQIRRVVGVVDDVTERRATEKRQRMLINELNHRVKNTLATVQSIAAQTLRSAPDLVSARDSFESRLVALAAAHDLLTAESWHGARLSDVVATTMAPFETVQRPQISRSGPPVWLSAPRALALSLALHELATNAAKYGALSVPEGSASIRWKVSGEELTLSWRETGGPPVTAPSRSGFGARLLQRSLAQELHGEVDVSFAPEGVRCEIRCQIEAVHASPDPAIGPV